MFKALGLADCMLFAYLSFYCVSSYTLVTPSCLRHVHVESIKGNLVIV